MIERLQGISLATKGMTWKIEPNILPSCSIPPPTYFLYMAHSNLLRFIAVVL